MKKLTSLSIFFPCLNDGRTLPNLVEKAYRVGEMVAENVDVTIIENGSSEMTRNVLERLEKKYSKLRVISYPKPLGYGGALREGFAHATGDWVFYTDGDGQYDPMELTKLIEKLSDRIDVVNGYKRDRKDAMYRNVLGSVYNQLLQRLYHPPIRDVDCDFRLIRRAKLSHIVLKTSSGLTCLELLLKLQKVGARFAEVGVSHFPRLGGRSEFFRFSVLMRTAFEHLQFAFLQKKV